jgi:hypothetical protein
MPKPDSFISAPACATGRREMCTAKRSGHSDVLTNRNELTFGELFRLGVLRPRCLLGARRHPRIVLGSPPTRRYTLRLAPHPMRHVREMLSRALASTRRQQHAGKPD